MQINTKILYLYKYRNLLQNKIIDSDHEIFDKHFVFFNMYQYRIEYNTDGKQIDRYLHREDGPAVCYYSGFKEYWVQGMLHRLDGPAREYSDGSKEYWVNGVNVTDKVKDLKEEEIPKYLNVYAL